MSQQFSSDLNLTTTTITTVPSGQLAIIDPTVEEYQMLAAGVLPGTQVVILDSNRDGVEQITEILHNFRNLEALHLISHGSPGTLYLGSTDLSLETLTRYANQLQQWDVESILLYGCNVAAGERGSQFVTQFAQWTGGAVAASQTRVGSQHLGGNWQLEATFNATHPIQMALAFDAATLHEYAGAFAPIISNLNDSSYNEQDPAIVLDSDITFSGGTNYQGGYLDFSLDAGTPDDYLTLLTDASPSSVLNQISIVGNNVYLGNGTAAAVIGSVDPTLNGQNGQSLRINFDNAFENGDFDSGAPGDTTIPGWTIVNQQVKFGVDTIAGLPTPIDTTIPASAPNADQNTATNPGTMTTALSAIQNDGSGHSVQLTSTGINTAQGFDIVRGPYIYSNGTVSLLPGDQVSFEWQAQGGGDAYDVYGYLVDVNTNNIVTILDETGNSATASTTWATETVTITQEGQYKFVFVSGTYDFTGGGVAGAQLFIDDVTVNQLVPPPAVLDDSLISTLAQKVQYNNPSDTPPASHNLTVSVQNNAVETAMATAVININPVNDQPSFTATTAPLPVNEDAGLQTLNTWASFNPGPADEAGQTATYIISNISDPSLFSVAPAVDASGNLTYTPAPDAFGTSTFDVAVQDSGGTANGGIDTSAPQTFTITVNPINDAPSFTNAGNQTLSPESNTAQTVANWASGFNFGPNENDQAVDQFIVSVINGTDLFTVAPTIANDGTLSFTPNGQVGTATVQVQLRDNGGTANGGIDTSDIVTFDITIPANTPPVVGTPIPDNSATAGEPFSFSLPNDTFSDPDGDPLTFTATLENGDPLPDWLTFDPATGTFSGTPTDGDIGPLNITVTASDGTDPVEDTFALTVGEVPNTPPVVETPLPDNTATAGEPFSFSLPNDTFSDPDGDPLTFTATLENGDPLPDWLTFDPATGTFSGTPTDGDIGPLNITVTASDGTDPVEDTFALTVGEVPNTPPVVETPLPDNTATAGEPFSFSLPNDTFSDPDGDPLTFTATLENGDPLPDWLTFNPATGTFSGSPADGDIGALNIRITATDPSNATISTAFNLEISEAADPNIGTPGDDTISGGEDNDFIDGGDGEDILDGGNGDDTISGGEGNDIIDGGDGDDSLSGGNGDDTISGGEGNDIIDGGDGEDSLSGGNNDDTIDGGEGNDIINGDDGEDSLSGGNGDDTIDGGEGNDIINGGDGEDSLSGGNGNDTIDGGEGNDIINGGDGEDSLSGGNGNDTIDGGEGNDILDGGEGDDILDGGNGDDTLIGGGGADTLEGGDGNDTYILDALTAAGTVINDASGTDSLLLNNATLSLTPTPGALSLLRDGNNLVIDLDGDGIYNPEFDLTVVNFFSPTGELPGTGFLESIGTLSGAEILAQLGNQTPPVSSPAIFVPLGPTGPTAFANFIAGLPEQGQQLTSPSPGQQLTSPLTDMDCNCPPMPAAPMVNLGMTPTIPATEGDDILLGSDFSDAITGFGGNDVIYGFGGNDLIVGDSGNDLLFGATGNDIIAGGTGDDVIYAGQGDDLVYAGQDNDFVYGDLGNDTLLGDKGNDIIFGGTSDLSLADLDGNDLIYGGEGDDQLHGNAGNDSLSGGVGDDLLRGGKDDDLLHGDEGNDVLWGDLGNDILCGGDGNDTLYGGNGSESPSTESDNDYLCGGNGDDWLIGGWGNNTLIGGAGSDRFILHHNGGTDLILDFTDGVDLIGLSHGLSFENLAITQGDVGTFITVDNQLLATLNNVNAAVITADDFFSFA